MLDECSRKPHADKCISFSICFLACELRKMNACQSCGSLCAGGNNSISNGFAQENSKKTNEML